MQNWGGGVILYIVFCHQRRMGEEKKKGQKQIFPFEKVILKKTKKSYVTELEIFSWKIIKGGSYYGVKRMKLSLLVTAKTCSAAEVSV